MSFSDWVFESGWGFLTLVIGVVIGVALAIGLVITITNAANRHMRAETCHNWSVQTGRPAKFASYTWWDYDCLTPATDGRWVSIYNVNGYAEVGR